jgi:cytochrome c553
MRLNKKTKIVVALLLLVFLAAQFYRPAIAVEKPDEKRLAHFSPDVDAILRRACFDCHSNQTALRWFDKITPANWLVADHIAKGRAVLNFSTWNDMAKPDRNAKLWEAVNQAIQGAMPLKSYALVHGAARLSVNDIQVLKNYVKELAPKQEADTAKEAALARQYAHWVEEKARPGTLPADVNGIAYIPEYKDWTPISTTQRVDNGTIRIIFGNEVAVKAIREHHTNPWPNGTIIAKVAWDQLTDEQGNITTGAFKQVEYMIKDDSKYKATAGWAWARFKTPALVPYGKTSTFTMECVNCHRPMKDNDFVFTAPIQH